jgi:hypothetical protein
MDEVDTRSEQERLDKVEEDIKEAKAEADEVIHPMGSDDGPRYYDSGDTPEEDDQTIAPG